MKMMSNRAGSYKTNLSGDLQYRSFAPAPLPPDPPIELDDDTVNLLAKANRSIGILEGLSGQIPDIKRFVSLYIRKEALLSSQIEGTQATLDDILDPILEDNLNQDVEEVLHYIKATQYGITRLQELPLCNRLIKEMHQVLMGGLRGGEKNPGEFRRSQNWIGPAGSTINNATFIPPAVEDLPTAMSDFEKFMNQEDNLDLLVKIALIHYQFETIHPFLDGNGRIGRLLVNLFLIENKILSHETLYISYYLKLNRIEYYDRLTEVRNKGNYEQWIKFFLLAIYESAQDAIYTAQALIMLRDRDLEKLKAIKAVKSTFSVFNYLLQSPIIDITKTAGALKMSYNTTATAVTKLVELGILKQTENVRRNRVFAYEEYLAHLRKGT
jgi:Fic family protein